MPRLPALALLLAFAPTAPAADKAMPGAEAAAKMTLPPGFRATLFAGEPAITQPLALTTDDRGRVWAVECNSYPEWSADRSGRDRVVILEDTDGNGRHDKRTVFLDGAKNLSGIELGHGGVWLCSLPNLLFVPVNPGEDKPAGPARVVLDGWSLDCKHNVVNSLIWGPDGWLWGLNGIMATSHVGKPGTPKAERTAINCGVWRVHPATHQFDVVATGTTNPFGLDFDDFGEAFITNCVIEHLWHVVPGAHFKRMFGQELAPDTFELMKSCAEHLHWAGGHWTASRGNKTEHSDAGGGHAHAGAVVYLGDNFPPEYRNSVLMGNIHGFRLNRDSLTRTTSGYAAKRAPDLAFQADPWFRPTTLKPAADGGVYVADWSDTGECHNYEQVDRTTGRIYKLTHGTPKPFTGDIAKLPDAELVALQRHKNDWHVRHARRVLAERAAAGTLTPETVPELRKLLAGDPDVKSRLRALWALHGVRGLKVGERVALMNDDSEQVRAWAVRLAADEPLTPEVAARLKALARSEPSPLVRLHLCGTVEKLPAEVKAEVAAGMLRSDDLTTPDGTNVALMEWYAVRSLGHTHPARLATVVASPVSRNPVARRLAARQAAAGGRFDSYLSLAAYPQDGRIGRDLLAGLLEGLADRPAVPPPAVWSVVGPKLTASGSAEIRTLAEELALKFDDPAVVKTLLARLTDADQPAAARTAAIDKLAARKTPHLADTLLPLLADRAVRGAAVRALAHTADPDAAGAVLAHYAQFTAAEKADAILTLASRPESAAKLLDSVAAGKVARADITAFTARQLLALNSPALAKRLGEVWGGVKPASATRAAQAAKFRALLTPDAVKSADVRNGRRLYAANCASCHKLFGDGGDVGPELTGSQRTSLDYVLENVLDPNAVVPFDYKMTALYLADGRVVTGLVKADTAHAVTVRTANELVVVPKADIDDRKATDNSVMPEGLLDALTDAEVRDLVAYLAAPAQVPLPAGE